LHGAITWISAFVVVTLRLVGRTQERQRNGREARAEFPKRGSARDGLGQAFGSFIELVLQKLNAVEPAISQNALVTSWAVAVRITLLRDRFRLRFVPEPERGQRDSRDADAKFLQRAAACY